jgi:hypothetical protein
MAENVRIFFSTLTLFYTPLKKTFNTFKRFQADPAKIFSQYYFKGLGTTLSSTKYVLLKSSPQTLDKSLLHPGVL